MEHVYIVTEYERTNDDVDHEVLGVYSTLEKAEEHVKKISQAIKAGRHPAGQMKCLDELYALDSVIQEMGYLSETCFVSDREDGYEVDYVITRHPIDLPIIHRVWETE